MGWRWGRVALACGALLVGCSERRQPAVADGLPIVGPRAIDFSRVALYDARELRVSLRNGGRARLELESLWLEGPDGAAYRAELAPGQARALAPGAESELAVRFMPGVQGAHPAFLAIQTDSLRQPVLRVSLRGDGVDARAVLSDRALDFGRIEAQSRTLRRLRLRNISDLPIQVSVRAVGVDSGDFTMEHTFSLAGYEARVVEITFAPEQVGLKQASIEVTPCAGCPVVPVELRAEALDRAVVAEPWGVDFGAVPVDRLERRSVWLHNISTEPARITALSLSTSTDASFGQVPVAVPITLAPDERREIELTYSPGHMGGAEGQVVVGVASARHPEARVPLLGWGGAAEICVSPVSHDFGRQPVGSKTAALVRVRSCGVGEAGPLVIHEVSVGGGGVPGEDEFGVEPLALPAELEAGEELVLKVFFEPTREGPAGGHLRLRTSAHGGASARVMLSGFAEAHPDCTLALAPQAIDFGTVLPGYSAVLGIRIRNTGADLCAVKNIRLVDDGGGAFTLPGGEIDGLLLSPGDAFSMQVAFIAPAAEGGSEGMLRVESTDPAQPRLHVPLRANAQGSCLIASPRWLDFGQVRPGCPPPLLGVSLSNACADPVEVTAVRIGPGTADGEFAIDAIGAVLPRALGPGESFPVRVSYRAQVMGMNLAPLFADVTALRAPLLVPLLGETHPNASRIEHFVQQDGSKVDVLLVVDNTSSMVEERSRFIAALPALADAARRRGDDLHVGITTTGIEPASAACPGGAQGGEGGRLFPLDGSAPRLLTGATPDLARLLEQNARVGECAFVERGLEAMRRALSAPLVDHADDPRTPLAGDGNLGLLRPEAGLVVVFVGDEDDHSPDTVDAYMRFLQGLKDEQPLRAVAYAIAPTEVTCATAGGAGTRYAQLARGTGGRVISICSPDYAPLLVDAVTRAFHPRDRFLLRGRPVAGTLRVSVDGHELSTGWSYDAAANMVVFASRPPAGSRIEVRYTRECS